MTIFEYEEFRKAHGLSIHKMAKALAKQNNKSVWYYTQILNDIEKGKKDLSKMLANQMKDLFSTDSKPDYMKYLPSPDEMKKIRARAGITRKEFLEWLGLGPDKISVLTQYENGTQKSSPMLAEAYYKKMEESRC